MNDSLRYIIRPADPSDEPFLREMLYQSLFVEEGCEPYPRDVLDHPHISRYVKGWGRAGDVGFIAVNSENLQPIGAVWYRLSDGDDKGFAYVDDLTPELGVAVSPEHRGRGVGTALLEHLLKDARGKCPAISLSVSPNNPAIRLYERLGFETVEIRGTHPVMVVKLEARGRV